MPQALIFTTAWLVDILVPHFTDEETEAKTGQKICPRSLHTWPAKTLVLHPLSQVWWGGGKEEEGTDREKR